MEENPNNGDERVSTVYINRDGAESIQWNWKYQQFIGAPGSPQSLNPFNGIERIGYITPTHTNHLRPRIHSMELKGSTKIDTM